nr:serine/threonine protein phosphatase [Bacteroides sp.]
MKILHLSDTHGCHRRLGDLPEADVVVHSGDFTMNGSEAEAIDFMNWLCDLPYAHKIFICGNHDECLYGANIDGLDSEVHYLCNSGVEIDGVKFYGVPMFMGDCITDRQSRNYGRIPGDTDVLITHSPAYGILDFDDGINYGSGELLARLSALNLKAHLFGHIHAQHGVMEHNGILFSNGAIINADYTNLNSPNELLI